MRSVCQLIILNQSVIVDFPVELPENYLKTAQQIVVSNDVYNILVFAPDNFEVSALRLRKVIASSHDDNPARIGDLDLEIRREASQTL